MRAHAVAGTWAVTERILVVRQRRPARRAAGARGPPHGGAAPCRVARRLRRDDGLRSPRRGRQATGWRRRSASPSDSAASRSTIAGERVADELVRYAKERNVTEIVLGKPSRSWWRTLLSPSPIPDVIDRSGDIDVRLDHGRGRRPRPTTPARRARRRDRDPGRGYLLGARRRRSRRRVAAKGLELGGRTRRSRDGLPGRRAARRRGRRASGRRSPRRSLSARRLRLPLRRPALHLHGRPSRKTSSR